MSKFVNTAGSIATALLRVTLLVLVMTGPVLALTIMKANNAPKISGAGLVLVVSIERNA